MTHQQFLFNSLKIRTKRKIFLLRCLANRSLTGQHPVCDNWSRSTWVGSGPELHFTLGSDRVVSLIWWVRVGVDQRNWTGVQLWEIWSYTEMYQCLSGDPPLTFFGNASLLLGLCLKIRNVVVCIIHSRKGALVRLVIVNCYPWPMTLNLKLDVDGVKMNQRVKYLSQMSFSSEVIAGTHTHTHTPERLLYLNY